MTVSTIGDVQHRAAAEPRYGVSVEQYVAFRRDGFLVVRDLIRPSEIAELRQHTEELMQGTLPEQQQQQATAGASRGRVLEAPPAHLSPEEKAQFFLRIHMLHRALALPTR
jgi:hypothetical protein